MPKLRSGCSIQHFYLFAFLESFESNFIINSGLSIIYTNVFIYIYIFYTLFALLFLFDTSKLKALSDLKVFAKFNFVLYSVVTITLSISGVPPFLGFSGKFSIFCIILFKQKELILCLFSILNFFSIYFYIQNLRFLANKTTTNFFLKKGFYFYINSRLINIIVFFNFFNFFGLFFIEDLYYVFLNVFFFKNLF